MAELTFELCVLEEDAAQVDGSVHVERSHLKSHAQGVNDELQNGNLSVILVLGHCHTDLNTQVKVCFIQSSIQSVGPHKAVNTSPSPSPTRLLWEAF